MAEEVAGTIEHQKTVVPVDSELEGGVAASFTHEFPAHSFEVVRVALNR